MILDRLPRTPRRAGRWVLAAFDRIGPAESLGRRRSDAVDYWLDPESARWQSNSHWRGALGTDRAWLEIGRGHLEQFDAFARALCFDRTCARVVEWGCGGGANAVHFGPRAGEFIGVDVSAESLDECGRQLALVCDTPYRAVLTDVGDPVPAAAVIGRTCDIFLCYYVLELAPSAADALEIVKAAARVLVPGGIAVIQIKYRTGHRRSGSRRRGYRRDLANMTTFAIDEFWAACNDCGLTPRLITLVPRNVLDERYAYFALTSPADGAVETAHGDL